MHESRVHVTSWCSEQPEGEPLDADESYPGTFQVTWGRAFELRWESAGFRSGREDSSDWTEGREKGSGPQQWSRVSQNPFKVLVSAEGLDGRAPLRTAEMTWISAEISGNGCRRVWS